MSVLNYAIPPILQIETTTACNLDCPFCLRKELCKSDEYLSLDAFNLILTRSRCRYVTLHGWGEPLLNKDLPEMIRRAKQCKKSVNFTSNATLLSSNANELFSSGLDAIAFSLPNIAHCKPEIAESISRFIALRATNMQKKPEICINIAIMEENLDQIDTMLAMAKNFGVDTIVFERSYPWTDVLHKKESDILQGIQRSAERRGIAIKLPPAHSNPCPLMRYTLFVRWNGDIAPCCYRADYKLGNILSDSIVKIMQSRATFLKSQKKDPVCSICTV